MLSNRGAQVWPETGGTTFAVDHYRARLMLSRPAAGDGAAEIGELLGRLSRAGLGWMHIEKLQGFGGKEAFSRS
jgi:isocitrate dehydrogenase